MLMVIFGAGASYDSLPSRRPYHRSLELRYRKNWKESERERWRMPLSDQLFGKHPELEAVRQQYRHIMPIVPMLAGRPATESLEAALESLALQVDHVPRRRPQLLALRYYLRDVITRLEHKWNVETPVDTNYAGLIDQLEEARSLAGVPERELFVTFNYDRMIERALEHEGQTFTSCTQYLSGPGFRLFKPHGSIDWERPAAGVPPAVEARMRGEGAFPLIAHASEIDISGDPALNHELPPGPKVPAIAVPFRSKASYECPRDHLRLFKEFLPRVRSILTIGWRAGEDHFLRDLQEGLDTTSEMELMCVGADLKDSQTIAESLSARIRVSRSAFGDGGFSRFVASREGRSFFDRAMARWTLQ